MPGSGDTTTETIIHRVVSVGGEPIGRTRLDDVVAPVQAQIAAGDATETTILRVALAEEAQTGKILQAQEAAGEQVLIVVEDGVNYKQRVPSGALFAFCRSLTI